MGNPLLDKDFLRELDLNREKKIYARLASLDFDEQPIEYIEGRVTGGSINVDGTSTVRRTCNLTLFTHNVNINEFYWSLETKITVDIGVENNIREEYPDIIWFRQGTYVLTSFNTSIATNSASISISGKDKGCMLNGDIAGNLPSSIDFGRLETLDYTYEPIELDTENYVAYKYYRYMPEPVYDDEHNQIGLDNDHWSYSLDTGKTWNDAQGENEFGFSTIYPYYKRYTISTFTDLKLNDIIREAVHVYAKEPYHNIVINDLEDYGLELLQYSGDKSLFLLRNVNTTNFEHIQTREDKTIYTHNANRTQFTPYGTLENFLTNPESYHQDPRLDDWQDDDYQTKICFARRGTPSLTNSADFTDDYTVAVLEHGETSGYRMTDLVYNGELIANIGETLSSILDKIKNMLGDFEYFYDIDGHFVFQKKKTFINTSWNSIIDSNNERFAQSMAETSATQYSFEGNVLLTAIQHSPVLNNLKNDYSIWGNRKSITGADIPIHLRYAIHKKPNYYKAFDGKIYCTDLSLAQQVLEKTYKEIIIHYSSSLKEFTMQYADEMPPNLVRPEQKPNGLWTAGWWDIRDWAEYYKLVMDTDEDPKGTMKFYSYNSLEGCVPISSLNISGYNNNNYCWLVVVTFGQDSQGRPKYAWNFQHGSGNPSSGKRLCHYYETKYIENPNTHEMELKTVRVTDIADKDFIYPFAGCNDQHTYYNFLNDDVANGKRVYFYNPQFPGIDDLESYIEEQVHTEYEEIVATGDIKVVDWREIIYQMALDYYQHNEENDFLIDLKNNNKTANGDYLYPTGYTGYEQYYPDMQGFWRQLYCPIYDEKNLKIRYTMAEGQYKTVAESTGQGNYYTMNNKFFAPVVESFSCDFFLQEDYKENIDAEIAARGYGSTGGDGWINEGAAAACKYLTYFNNDYAPWARAVIEDPASLNFWIDFLDTGELGQFDVTAIGARQKVVSDNDVKCIYNKEVPDIIFVSSNENFSNIDRKTGYTYCRLTSSLENLFTISAMGKSAKELLDQLLYQFSYCIENITLTSVPIYYLQPNTRIFVHDDKSKIDGDYIVTKFTLPLAYNGTMSITANKAPQRIY